MPDNLMTETTVTETQRIPQAAVDRFLGALSSLIATGREAVAASVSPQSSVWQRKVQPMLEDRLAKANSASARFAAGDAQPLIATASALRFLARDMDGYSLHFAGDDFARRLEGERRLVIYAAWQICQAAGAL